LAKGSLQEALINKALNIQARNTVSKTIQPRKPKQKALEWNKPMLISGFEKNQICNSSIYYYLFP
jgi:hypothetical protein